jgi:hypothetical protein
MLSTRLRGTQFMRWSSSLSSAGLLIGFLLPVHHGALGQRMGRQIAHEIRGRGVTLAGLVAIGSLAFATWAFIPNAYSTSDVESCDTTLGPAALGLDFSGVFEGGIVESGQSGTAAQVKFVRDGSSVRGRQEVVNYSLLTS